MKKTRIFAFILTLSILFSLLSVNVFAEAYGGPGGPYVVTEMKWVECPNCHRQFLVTYFTNNTYDSRGHLIDSVTNASVFCHWCHTFYTPMLPGDPFQNDDPSNPYLIVK